MSTSGTYAFNPSLGETTLFAFMNAGIRPTALVQEHMMSARMATNSMLSRWANQGVNLWTVDLVTVPLLADTKTYDVDANTVVMLDAYISVVQENEAAQDRIILPVSRTEYASYSNKDMIGFPTVFWFDRLLSPTVTIWPVPEEDGVLELKYYRTRQIQDAAFTAGQQVEIPYLWFEAFADGLAYRLAKIWNPQLAINLKQDATDSYAIAASQNIETAQQYISPMISSYYRL